MEINQLNLLLPEKLPVDSQLEKASKEKILLSLDLSFQSLGAECREQAILQVERALAVLGTTETVPGNFQAANVRKCQKISEYDNYFNVYRIKTKESEICLLKSVLVAYRRFLLLCYKTSNYNAENIDIQTKGFATYFKLLSRVLNLPTNINDEKN